jgi:xanthine dehydrogenase YagR molybdenum-binding subunit
VTSIGYRAVGDAVERVDARVKATGEALFAYEYPIEGALYAVPVQATIARGAIRSIDTRSASALPGVAAVLSHQNAPRLQPVENAELHLFQSARVAYRGQIVAAVVAEQIEIAQEAAALIAVHYDVEPHDVDFTDDRPGFFKPPHAAHRVPESVHGDVEAALAAAAVVVDRRYTTPAEHNLPMEPHATLAVWDSGTLTLYESSQFPYGVRMAMAELLGVSAQNIRVINRNVGGGFGSKGQPGPQTVLAILASMVTDRPVKVALSRRQMFAISGYRSPTVQRIRLGAEPDGRLVAWEHQAYSQTSNVRDFTEPSTTGTRVMYAAEHRFNTHHLIRLDVPTPGFCRAPGKAPGSFALESALDELAERCGVDPVELRIRNEPAVDPDSGLPFSSRNLVACLREGAELFGWSDRRRGRDGRWLIGSGVASSAYPSAQMPSQARVRTETGEEYVVEIAATDVGTGARTALAQIAADELDTRVECVRVDLGDSAMPYAIGSFGSFGTSSWGHAVVLACRLLRERLDAHGGEVPAGGLVAEADTTAALEARAEYSTHSFGAQFAEVRVDADTAEVRVSRLVGVFAAGRIVNPRTARSQLHGGMIWGVSMALHEESIMDPNFGDYVNGDFASYHIATAADVPEIDVAWIDEHDPHINPSGTKGIGEVGIVGTAAAIANAVYDATGIRVRDLPVRLDRLLV